MRDSRRLLGKQNCPGSLIPSQQGLLSHLLVTGRALCATQTEDIYRNIVCNVEPVALEALCAASVCVPRRRSALQLFAILSQTPITSCQW
jgi:hypothetical protein